MIRRAGAANPRQKGDSTTNFQGFATREEAVAFQRQHGGMLCWEERTTKRQQLTQRGRDYMFAVTCGGLNRARYPYCVQWTGRKTMWEFD